LLRPAESPDVAGRLTYKDSSQDHT